MTRHRSPDGISRRDLLRLAGVGGVVFSSGLAAARKRDSQDPFYFLQLSDTHWGYTGPANPEAATTLDKAVATINSVERRPPLVVFTGDLTHSTDDAALRRKRMAEFKAKVSALHVPKVHYLPGEHDAARDGGAAFREHFGPTYHSFDEGNVHFVALDNVSAPDGKIGDQQIDWLHRDLAPLDRDAAVVVLAHKPLFDLYPAWEWSTPDGARAIDVLLSHHNVTVFYGHIHQEHRKRTEHITHYAARSLIFPLPAPGSQPKRAPLPWDRQHPFQGIGYRRVAKVASAEPELTEQPVVRG
jgi:3',5'-cyclic AMP phosphodiesterase CpdA